MVAVTPYERDAAGTRAGARRSPRMSKPTSLAMPEEVRAALGEAGAEADYRARPPYQRNDYLGWIGGAKQDSTRRRRIARMVAELKEGGVYMGMAHGPSAKA